MTPQASHLPHDLQSLPRTVMASATSGGLPPASATTFEVSALFRSASLFAITLAHRLVARLVCFLARISDPKASESATACGVVKGAVSGRAGLTAALSGSRLCYRINARRNSQGSPYGRYPVNHRPSRYNITALNGCTQSTLGGASC